MAPQKPRGDGMWKLTLCELLHPFPLPAFSFSFFVVRATVVFSEATLTSFLQQDLSFVYDYLLTIVYRPFFSACVRTKSAA